MSHYEHSLETVSDVDSVLKAKASDLPSLIPEQRNIVMRQIDTLLELRTKLGNLATVIVLHGGDE